MTEMLPGTRLELSFLCEAATVGVLSALEQGPASDTDIAGETGLVRATVRSRLQRLETLGLVVRAGERRARAQGKRAQLWALTDAADALALFARNADAFVLDLLSRRGERHKEMIASRRRDEVAPAPARGAPPAEAPTSIDQGSAGTTTIKSSSS